MALTTTGTRSSVMLSAILNDVALEPLTPKLVFWNLINHDDMDGEPALTKSYPKKTDVGPAGPATEGVDFTNSTALGYDAAINLTPVESAVMRVDITTRAMRRKFPGETSVALAGRMLDGDFRGLLGMLEEEARTITKSLQEKAERDCTAQLQNASTTVGSTGVDLSVANLLLAIADLEGNEPEHEDFVFCMAAQQTADLRTALLSTSSASSATWFAQADASFLNFHPDAPRNGLKGSFLGIPWYQTSPSVNPLPNSGADVAGALLCRGVGRPGAPGSLRGAHVFLEGAPPYFLLDIDPSARAIEMLGIWEYAVGEITDPHYVSIVTDAP